MKQYFPAVGCSESSGQMNDIKCELINLVSRCLSIKIQDRPLAKECVASLQSLKNTLTVLGFNDEAFAIQLLTQMS